KLFTSTECGSYRRFHFDGMGCGPMGCREIAYSVLPRCFCDDHKSWVCDEYDFAVYIGSDCRCSNSWNSKPYTFIRFLILSGDNAFNSAWMGIMSWTNRSDIRPCHWCCFTSFRLNFAAKFSRVCYSRSDRRISCCHSELSE